MSSEQEEVKEPAQQPQQFIEVDDDDEDHDTEDVQFETDDIVYDGQVIEGTQTMHGEGILLDKKLLQKYIGTFVNGKRSGDTGQLQSIDPESDFEQYSGGF